MKTKNVIRFLVIGLCVAGALLSAVSLRSHYSTSPTDYCDLDQTFNCDLVNRSIYSRLAGIPVALIGLGGYVLLLLLSLRHSPVLAGLRFFASVMGLGFALYLAYVEAYVLAVWCLLCIGSLTAIAGITLLTGVSLWQTWRRQSKPEAFGPAP